MKNTIVYFVRLTALAAALLAAACGTAPPRGTSSAAPAHRAQDDAQLPGLALERWNLLIAHHAEKAYDYLSPGTRATETREKYAAEMNNRPVHWKSVEYVDRKCDDPDACTLQLRAAFSVAMTARIGKDVDAVTMLWERWIRIDGHWYYLQERPTDPAGKAAAGTRPPH